MISLQDIKAETYPELIGAIRTAYFDNQLSSNDRIAAIADPRIFNLPDSELDAITRSYSLPVSPVSNRAAKILNILRSDRKDQILTPYRKSYSAEDVIELFYINTWDGTSTIAEFLSLNEPRIGTNLFEILQLEYVITPETRLVLDQPAVIEALKNNTREEVVALVKELQRDETQIPYRYRNLTYDQLVNFYQVQFGQVERFPTRLLLVNNNQDPTEQVKKKSVFKPNPIFKLSQLGLPVSYLPITVTDLESRVIEDYTRNLKTGVKDRPETLISITDRDQNFLQLALERGEMPIRAQNWWIPEGFYRELYHLARYPPVQIITTRRTPILPWTKYDELRRTDIVLISRLLCLKGNKWSSIMMCDNETQRYWLTRNALPRGFDWLGVQERYLEYQWVRDGYSDELLNSFEEMISKYLGLGFDELDIGVAYANRADPDPGFQYLGRFINEEESQRVCEELGIVPSARLNLMEGAMAQFSGYRPYLFRPRGFQLPFNLSEPPAEPEAVNWMYQLSDLELLETWGIQPDYRNREVLVSNLYKSLSEGVFAFVLGDNCVNKSTPVELESTEDPAVTIIGYGTQSAMTCFTISELEALIDAYPNAIELPLIDQPNSGKVYPSDSILGLQGLLISIGREDVAQKVTKYIVVWDLSVKELIDSLSEEERAQIIDWFRNLFNAGMYMRRWSGQGPYPMSLRETLVDVDPFPNVTMALNHLLDLEDEMSETLRRVLASLKLRTPPREDVRIQQLISDIRAGDVCIRIASNYIAKSAYDYLLMMGYQVPNFDPEKLDFIV